VTVTLSILNCVGRVHRRRLELPREPGDKPVLDVDKVASILRATALHRAIKEPDFPMPPANTRAAALGRRTERLLWAPQDYGELLQNVLRRLKPKRSLR
jgi:hypothetical protein